MLKNWKIKKGCSKLFFNKFIFLFIYIVHLCVTHFFNTSVSVVWVSVNFFCQVIDRVDRVHPVQYPFSSHFTTICDWMYDHHNFRQKSLLWVQKWWQMDVSLMKVERCCFRSKNKFWLNGMCAKTARFIYDEMEVILLPLVRSLPFYQEHFKQFVQTNVIHELR